MCEPTILTFGHREKVPALLFPSVTDVSLLHLTAEIYSKNVRELFLLIN